MSSKSKKSETTTAERPKTQPPDRKRSKSRERQGKDDETRQDDYSKGYTEALCDVRRNIVNMINDQETDNEDNDEESSDDEEQGSDEEDGNEEDEYDDDDANQTERDQINDLIESLKDRLEDL